jgi:hypothetical protein
VKALLLEQDFAIAEQQHQQAGIDRLRYDPSRSV